MRSMGSDMRWQVTTGRAAVLTLGTCLALGHGACREATEGATAREPAPPKADSAPATAPTEAVGDPTWVKAPAPAVAPTLAGTPRWIAIGGVDGPSANQVSIEDELELVRKTFGEGQGLVLYAGGPGSHGVQIADPEPRGEAWLRVLGELVDPRAGRDAHYRPVARTPHGAGTRQALEGALAVAASAGADAGRLLVWLAGHGAPGEHAKDVGLATWGGDLLTVDALSEALGVPRKTRVVATQCFAGGFADAVLDHADTSCGLFATTWELESSGCDSDPERARDSYGVLVLKALSEAKNDLDGDGQVGLAEAHVAAVVGGPGIEVPVLSSEIDLARAFDVELDPNVVVGEDPWTREERTMLAGLLAKIPPELVKTSLEAGFDALADDEKKKADALDEADLDEAMAASVAKGALLMRWPVLDDPWHPDFARTLQTEGEAIKAWLSSSEAITAWRDRLEAADRARLAVDTVRAQLAPLHRAIIAKETAIRVAMLRQRASAEAGTAPGSAASPKSILARFEALRACEREGLK